MEPPEGFLTFPRAARLADGVRQSRGVSHVPAAGGQAPSSGRPHPAGPSRLLHGGGGSGPPRGRRCPGLQLRPSAEQGLVCTPEEARCLPQQIRRKRKALSVRLITAGHWLPPLSLRTQVSAAGRWAQGGPVGDTSGSGVCPRAQGAEEGAGCGGTPREVVGTTQKPPGLCHGGPASCLLSDPHAPHGTSRSCCSANPGPAGKEAGDCTSTTSPPPPTPAGPFPPGPLPPQPLQPCTHPGPPQPCSSSAPAQPPPGRKAGLPLSLSLSLSALSVVTAVSSPVPCKGLQTPTRGLRALGYPGRLLNWIPLAKTLSQLSPRAELLGVRT